MPFGNVHQLVFGYRDGHQLLATSEALQTKTLSELLPHLDASFEDPTTHYVVGSSLGSVERYLLAKIWPADEVSRPGAVWAHGLLLDEEALTQGVRPWLAALRRPRFETLDEFRQPAAPGEAEPIRASERVLTALAWAAFGPVGQPVVVLLSDLGVAEDGLTGVLDALPTRAVGALSFRTRGRASLAPGRYVLQVAPQITGSRGKEAAVLDLRTSRELEAPRWAGLALDTPDGHAIRSYLRSYSDADASSRKAIGSLLRIWTMLREPSMPIDAVRDSLIEGFPTSSEVRALRGELFGNAQDHAALWSVSEASRLRAIIETPNAFDRQDLRLKDRLEALWKSDSSSAVELTALALPGAAADVSLEAAVVALTSDHLEAVSAAPDLIEPIIGRRLDVLLDAGSWASVSQPVALGLIERFRRSVDVAALSHALIASGRSDLIRVALDLDSETTSELLHRASATSQPCTLDRFYDAHPDVVWNWLAAARLSLDEAVGAILALDVDRLQSRSLATWRSSAARLHTAKSERAAAAASVLLVLGLSASDGVSDALLRDTFAPVHVALCEGTLDRSYRKKLVAVLPPGERDPAARLRRALVDRATDRQWSKNDLARALEGTGKQGARVSELLPKKHPFLKVAEAAVKGVSGLVR